MKTSYIYGVSKHPLSILIIGTLLTAILLPRINAVSNLKKVKQEKKINLSVEILRRSTKIDTELNSAVSEIEHFHKTSSFFDFPDDKLEIYQDRCRIKVNTIYTNFNSTAWWWYWDIYYEAKLLKLLTEDRLHELEELIMRYEKNLIQTTEVFEPLWFLCINPTYNPKNSKNNLLSQDTRNKVNTLLKDRTRISVEMANIFQATLD